MLVSVLGNTLSAAEAPRKQAEIDLITIKKEPQFLLAALSVGRNTSLSVEIRQAALTSMRMFVQQNWSPEENDGFHMHIPDEAKNQIRPGVLDLVLNAEDERKVKIAAR